MKKMTVNEDKKIKIYQGRDYLIKYSGGFNDYPPKWKELKGEDVIDFLKEINDDRSVSEITVYETRPATEEEASKDENDNELYCTVHIYDSPKYGLYKQHRPVRGTFAKGMYNRWKNTEGVSELKLLKLTLVIKHSINWFFRDFTKHVENTDHSTIKKRS